MRLAVLGLKNRIKSFMLYICSNFITPNFRRLPYLILRFMLCQVI
jgi:hypothetical protein